MVSINDIPTIRAASAVSSDGHKVGRVGDVYVDDLTNEPAWVTITAGLFGTKTLFAPLEGATVDGDRLVLAYVKDVIAGAPPIADSGHISEHEQSALIDYFTQHRAFVASERVDAAGAAPTYESAAPVVEAPVVQAAAPVVEAVAPVVAAPSFDAAAEQVLAAPAGIDAPAPVFAAEPIVDPYATVTVPATEAPGAPAIEVPEALVDAFRPGEAPEPSAPAVEVGPFDSPYAAPATPPSWQELESRSWDVPAPIRRGVEEDVAAYAQSVEPPVVRTPSAPAVEVGPFDSPYAAPATPPSWQELEARSWDAPAPIRQGIGDEVAPVVEAPAVEAPAAPVVQTPVVEDPVVEAHVAPVAEAHVVEDPVVEAHVAPVAQAHVVEDPVVEAHVAPVAEAHVAPVSEAVAPVAAAGAAGLGIAAAASGLVDRLRAGLEDASAKLSGALDPTERLRIGLDQASEQLAGVAAPVAEATAPVVEAAESSVVEAPVAEAPVVQATAESDAPFAWLDDVSATVPDAAASTDLPSAEWPPVEVPSVDLPAVDLPSVDLPSVDVPEVHVPDAVAPIADAVTDVAPAAGIAGMAAAATAAVSGWWADRHHDDDAPVVEGGAIDPDTGAVSDSPADATAAPEIIDATSIDPAAVDHAWVDAEATTPEVVDATSIDSADVDHAWVSAEAPAEVAEPESAPQAEVATASDADTATYDASATAEGEWGAEPVAEASVDEASGGVEAGHHEPVSGVAAAPAEGDTAAQDAHSGLFRMHPGHTRETIYRDGEGNILYSIVHKFEDVFGLDKGE